MAFGMHWQELGTCIVWHLCAHFHPLEVVVNQSRLVETVTCAVSPLMLRHVHHFTITGLPFAESQPDVGFRFKGAPVPELHYERP
jgi:hypothetical protein